MTTDTFSVPEVHCDHCKSSIEGAVGALEGVASVTVDIDGRSVEVSWDEGAMGTRGIVAAIEEQGYTVAE